MPVVVIGAVLLAVVSSALGCASSSSDGPAPECAAMADCAGVEKPCDGCAPLGDELCLEGSCADRGEDSVTVTATVNIEPRQLDVTSLVHAVVSMTTATGTLRCEDAVSAGGFADDLAVLASGYKSLSGGSFHPDLGFGRVPAGDVAVVLLGTSGGGGDGDVIATGCLGGLEATGDALTIDLVVLQGL